MLKVLGQAGVSQALSAVVPGQSLAGKQHPRTRIGFRVETISELDRQLVASGTRVDRVLCRLSPAPTAAAAIDEIARLDSLQAIGNIDVQLELLGQDVRSAANQVAESLAAVTRLHGSRLFIDPLIDFDRTMDVRHGLLDPFCNPRPAFHVLRCLNTILAAAGNAFGSGESRIGWLETGSVVFGTIETSTASIGLLLPATPVPVEECPAEVTAWCSPPGPLSVYHLAGGLLTETTTDGLVTCSRLTGTDFRSRGRSPVLGRRPGLRRFSQQRRQRLAVGNELYRDRIDAVAGVPGGHVFTKEDMAKMTTTTMANDLGPPTVGVHVAIDGPGDLVIEAGPATTAVELVSGLIKRRLAATADVGALVLQVGEFAGERLFGALVDDDVRLLGRQLIERVCRRRVGSHETISCEIDRTYEPGNGQSR